MDLYHALNRGVDKRTIFLDGQDYARFVHNMYEFNDTENVHSTYRHFPEKDDVRRRPLRTRECIVAIHGWCLMGNHYHMILSELVEGGISLFLKKLNGGYAKYFNERYTRSGALFQGRTKRILLKNDGHFLHILNYVHFNPLDFQVDSHDWRNGKISSSKEALDFLRKYKWSSYRDYVGIRNFPSILSKTFFSEVFNNRYGESAEKYLQDIAQSQMREYFIE